MQVYIVCRASITVLGHVGLVPSVPLARMITKPRFTLHHRFSIWAQSSSSRLAVALIR
jgi:hypothetical protein